MPESSNEITVSKMLSNAKRFLDAIHGPDRKRTIRNIRSALSRKKNKKKGYIAELICHLLKHPELNERDFRWMERAILIHAQDHPKAFIFRLGGNNDRISKRRRRIMKRVLLAPHVVHPNTASQLVGAAVNPHLAAGATELLVHPAYSENPEIMESIVHQAAYDMQHYDDDAQERMEWFLQSFSGNPHARKSLKQLIRTGNVKPKYSGIKGGNAFYLHPDIKKRLRNVVRNWKS